MTDIQTTPTSQAIDAAVDARAMLAHPFYRAWTDGQLTLGDLRAYAGQYFHHVEAFPRAVSAVHAACPDRLGRRMLAENLAEEEGVGEGRQDHASLWMMFAQGMGADRPEVESTVLNLETRALIDAFRRLSTRSYAAGLGALYAYESQFAGVARAKIEGLVERYGVTDEPTLRFFRVHEHADVAHSAVCRDLLDRLHGVDRADAVNAGQELAAALWGFLSGVERQVALKERVAHAC